MFITVVTAMATAADEWADLYKKHIRPVRAFVGSIRVFSKNI